MSGQQEFAEEMRKHTARLASSVKQHKTLLEKLKELVKHCDYGVEKFQTTSQYFFRWQW